MAKTLQFDRFDSHGKAACAVCEEMITDALDAVLSPADQRFFDHHLAGCVDCMTRYADARRGAAWLEMLRTPRPEPSDALLERILSGTVGLTGAAEELEPGDVAEMPLPMLPVMPHVLPFVPRPATSGVPVGRFTRFTRLAMEPRYAMTAAMAFFSIALTMNLMGVRLDQMHARDFTPSGLRRQYYETNASVVRYYDNLRVVRVLESRVDDMRQANEDDRGFSGSQPSAPPSSSLPKQEPAPLPKQEKPTDPHGAGADPHGAGADPRGSSRRESPLPEPGLMQTGYAVVPEPMRGVPAVSMANRTGREGGLG